MAVQNTTTVLSSDPSIQEFFGTVPSSTGVAVNELSAMRVAAVYACVRIIAGAIASLPLDIYRREPNGQRKKVNEADSLWWLLNEEPQARWTASSMWKWLIKSELLRGDGFARIIRAPNGTPIELQPIRALGTYVKLTNNRLTYFYLDDYGEPRGCDQEDMLHIPGFGFDGLRGMSAIQWGAKSGIGIAIATDEFSGRFFGSGAMVRHVIKAPGKMNEGQREALREAWVQRHTGLENAYRPLILTEGLDVSELSLSAEDSQLLEARKFQVIDICRAFGVPPFMVGETEKTTSFGAGVEHLSLGFIKYTLQDRLTSIEQELNRKLFRTASRFVKFNVDELLRGDAATRATFLRQMVGGSQGPGIISQNAARLSEGYIAIPGADSLYDPTTAKGTPANAPA